MMRCDACNAILSQRDESRMGAHTGLPLNLCTPCVKSTDIEFTENPIAPEESPEEVDLFDTEISETDDEAL